MMEDQHAHIRLVRSNDPDTSLMAAIKASRASRVATQITWRVMLDGKDRTDEEIWSTCRSVGYISSLSVIQHARLTLLRTGYLADTGSRRKTSDGAEATVWINVHPMDAPLPALLYDPRPKMSRRQELKRDAVRAAPPADIAKTWCDSLRELCVQARRHKIVITPNVVELGQWLKKQSRL